MSTYTVGMDTTVEIIVGDQTAIDRCTENHDEDGQAQPDVRGGTGWRNSYYALTTPEKVLQHWADNCLRNGVEDASRLDGWGDLAPGVVTMRCTHTDIDWTDGPA